MTGSDACTVIALLTGRHLLEGALAIPKELKDLGQTIPFYSKMIFKGNHIYMTLSSYQQTNPTLMSKMF